MVVRKVHENPSALLPLSPIMIDKFVMVLLFSNSIQCQTSNINQSMDEGEGKWTVPSTKKSECNFPAQFVSLAPCPCDLTKGSCDFSCSCDGDCLEVERPGCIERIDMSVSTCFLPSIIPRQELSLFLCILHSNTPFLGHFYPDVPFISTVVDDEKYHLIIDDKIDIVLRQLNEYGSVIDLSSDYLRFPTSILDNSCSWTNPIRFLIDQDSRCIFPISFDVCTTDYRLKSSSFIKKTNTVDRKIKYVCKKRSQSISELNPEPCTFPEPSLDDSLCSNVVHLIRYDLFWNASFLINLTATVILDDIQLNTGFIEQRFIAKWIHSYDLSNSESTKQITGIYPRSGNPGYDFGRPLISAIVVNGNDFGNVDNDKQLFLWKPGLETRIKCPSPKCNFTEQKRLNFGQNATASCYIQLSRESFKECTRLIGQINEQINRLFVATHISKLGTISLNDSIAVNFVRILSINDFDSELSVSSSTRALCKKIPTSVTLEIFYAETAFINGKSILEIVGALKYYNYSTWRYSLNEDAQLFQLFANVRFFKKLPFQDKRIKSFYSKRARFHCPSEVTCWNELFFPFTRANIGTDYSFSLAIALIIVAAIIACYIGTKPWAV